MNAEPRRQFVDTNILVYAHDGSGGRKYDIAADLLRRLWADRQGCVSTQVLQELYVTITRKVPHPLASPAQATSSLNWPCGTYIGRTHKTS